MGIWPRSGHSGKNSHSSSLYPLCSELSHIFRWTHSCLALFLLSHVHSSLLHSPSHPCLLRSLLDNPSFKSCKHKLGCLLNSHHCLWGLTYAQHLLSNRPLSSHSAGHSAQIQAAIVLCPVMIALVWAQEMIRAPPENENSSSFSVSY